MRKKTAAVLLSAGLVTGGGAALFVPAVALAADSGTESSAGDRAAARLTAIKDALKGLVSDGTITQSQADKVASTLAASDLGGPGGRGGHGPDGGPGGGPGGSRVSPEATAAVIGITVDELRSAQQEGKTLAEIAEANGVSRSNLINGLVAAAQKQLAADVTAGRLTQAQSDEASANLTERVTERVDRAGRVFGGGGPEGGNREGTATPAPSATSS